jgi:hypothetical protein
VSLPLCQKKNKNISYIKILVEKKTFFGGNFFTIIAPCCTMYKKRKNKSTPPWKIKFRRVTVLLTHLLPYKQRRAAAAART